MTATAGSGPLVVRIDKDAFLAQVKQFVDVSPAVQAIGAVLKLSWPNALIPPMLFETIGKIRMAIEAVISAVEVAKQKLIDDSGTPGAKFDKELALSTAVELLDSLIVFEGFVGRLLDKIDRPILNLVVSIVVNGKPKDWLAEAKMILGLL